MEHLFDTCTIKHELKTDTIIFSVANYCYGIEEPFTISTLIKKELQPPNTLEQAEYKQAKKVAAYVDRYITSGHIKVIDINTDEGVRLTFNKIRQYHYGWMTRWEYCKQLIEKGELTIEEYKSQAFRRRDAGECSLIAIALSAPSNFIIISEDAGKVYKHPHINIFDIFKSKGLQIVPYKEWSHFNDVTNDVQ
jgi:hypothetical protein